jgi:hypothetical protein
MELDHIFLFVASEAVARSMMQKAGLRVNYSRSHPGQGTRNLCACLDDIFIELIWLDGTPISPESERVTLGARGRGEGSPLGVSWRGEAVPDCDIYSAPFLPVGRTIPFARASLDPMMPFIFQSPGGVRPIDRTDGLVGERQQPHLTTLSHCTISLPEPDRTAGLLASFDQIVVARGARAIAFAINGVPDRTITWPIG